MPARLRLPILLLFFLTASLAAACMAVPAATRAPTITLPPPTPTSMPHTPDPNFPATRDIRKWPFAPTSIWNMPIGSGAHYEPANIAPIGGGFTVDEDVLILAPDAPLVEVYYNHEGWSGRNRCEKQGDLVGRYPIPAGYLLPHSEGTPNNSAAILLPDGRTVFHTQPLQRCPGFDYATTGYLFPELDLYGPGITGSHGGSGLSALGGTLRLGELVPGGTIRHALKVNLYARINLFYDAQEATPGYRWPAVTADGYAGDPNSPIRYGGRNPLLEMGALLALHPSFDPAQLESEPGRTLARALPDYGAYVVDDTAWDVYALATEQGPDGRVVDEFEQAWGFSMTPPTLLGSPWGRDIGRIFAALMIVNNNTPETIGGGGTPRQLLAPEVKP